MDECSSMVGACLLGIDELIVDVGYLACLQPTSLVFSSIPVPLSLKTDHLRTADSMEDDPLHCGCEQQLKGSDYS